MKKLTLLLLAGLLLGTLSAELIDRIVAKVGTDIILMSDVYKQMQQMQTAGLDAEQIKPGIALQQLIEQKVIFQKAQELDVKSDDAAVLRMAQNYLRQVKEKYPSGEAFAADLAKEKLTESDLLEFYQSLLREKDMSDQLEKRYVTSQVSVSEREMEEFYASSKDSLAVKPVTWDIGLIMYEIKPSKESEDAKLAEIRAIQERLNQGEKFADLAREYSDCPSKEQGGDLGYFSKGMMVKPFEDAAFALSAGEISDVVRTEYGFHLIKVDAVRANEVRASHILKILSPTEADTVAARQTMETIRSLYSSGEKTFAELAAQYSIDPEAATNGGNIGEMSEAEFPELFAPQIQAAPVGELTPVLENEGILYLFIKLREIPSRVYTYPEIQDKLRSYLTRLKQAQAYETWIAKLIGESYVQVVE